MSLTFYRTLYYPFVVDNVHSSSIYQPAELAKMLSVSRQTVYKGLRDGTIPSIRLGRRFVIPKAAIEKWLESGGTPSAQNEN